MSPYIKSPMQAEKAGPLTRSVRPFILLGFPILTGSSKLFSANLTMPLSMAPPPLRTTPAGILAAGPIFFISPFIIENISSMRGSIISIICLSSIIRAPSFPALATLIFSLRSISSSHIEPCFILSFSASWKEVLNPIEISELRCAEPTGSTPLYLT